MSSDKKQLSAEQCDKLFGSLKFRFGEHRSRHKGLEWAKVQVKLEGNTGKLWSLYEMERTGGEPDVVDYDN